VNGALQPPQHHSALNETAFPPARKISETKPPHRQSRSTLRQEEGMRGVIFSAVLLAAASVGYVLISASLAATRDAKPATFSERFAPVLPSGATR
jgi:hypothetical protein